MIADMNKKTGISPTAALLLTGMWYIVNLLTHCRNKKRYQTALEKLAVLFKRRINVNDNEHYLSKDTLLIQKKVSSQIAAEVIQQSILHL